MTPYDNACIGNKYDAFNFYQLASRIYAECAFLEVDMRWGIFWKQLNRSIKNCKHVIDGAIYLHSIIIEWREASQTNVDNLNDHLEPFEEFGRIHPFEVGRAFGNNVKDECV